MAAGESSTGDGDGIFGGMFVECSTKDGRPVKFLNEEDLLDFPLNADVRLEPNAWRPDTRFAKRFRLTSHRLMWQETVKSREIWLATHLDQVTAVIDGGGGGLFRSPRVRVTVKSGGFFLVKCPEAALAEKLLSTLQQALAAEGWKKGAYEASSMGGLQKVLDQHGTRQRSRREELASALTDLESLRQKAVAASTVMQQLARQVETDKGESSAVGANGGDVKGLLQEFGLVGPGGKSIAVGADIEADVVKVCVAALESRGGLGMLLAHDVFCLVNRARGTALASPDEVMSAVRRSAGQDGPLKLRTLGSSSAWAVSLARTGDVETDAKLLAVVEELGPCSVQMLSGHLGLTAAEAQYLLRDAEERAVLVRDDAYEGVFYYRNFFNDF